MRIYYGWWVLAISMVVMMLVIGSTMNAFGLFVIPVSEDLKLSRANVNTGLILTNLGIAAVSPLVGRMLDIYPIRKIMTAAALLFGGSLITLGLSQNVWLSAVVLAAPLAIGIAGVGTLTSMSLVARWFEAQRGRAMALAVMGMSLGTVIMAPLIGWMIETIGWRQCLMIVGGVLGLVFLALVPFVREKPGPDDIEPKPAGGGAEAQPIVASEPVSSQPLKPFALLRMPQYWMLAVGSAFAMGALQAVMVSLVPLGQEAGLSATQAASLLSAIGGFSIAAKFILIWIGDRLDRSLVLSLLFGVIALMSIALLLAHDYVTLLACSAFLGFGVGATMPIFLALLADRVGSASFGTANGIAGLLMALMGAVAIRYSGEIYDRTGSYDLMFLSFIGVSLLAAFLVFLSGRFRNSRMSGAFA